MKKEPAIPTASNVAAGHLVEASLARKCWPCGCFHDALRSLDISLPESGWPMVLSDAIRGGKEKLTERRYDCLGCEVCYPALALNALSEEGNAVSLEPCPTDLPKAQEGWPPLPGDYRVLRYQAPVAVCTLSDVRLFETLSKSAETGLSIVGTLHTENLGIERIITNVLGNPHLRFLIVCGADSRQSVGHLPGQSLFSLMSAGLDENGKIIGALGKRPVLKNISLDAVEHFRKVITLLDMRGVENQDEILARIREYTTRKPGRSAPFPSLPTIEVLTGNLPARMVPDPAGYFVVYPDPARKKLVVEHYQNNGRLNKVITGRDPAEITTTAIEHLFVSRLDHAAYLGQELARAEASLFSGSRYVQDRAPESLFTSSKGTGACQCVEPCPES